MTTAQYLKALKRLALTPAGKLTAKTLGVGLRALARYSAGQKIPQPVANLLTVLVTFKINPRDLPWVQ